MGVRSSIAGTTKEEVDRGGGTKAERPGRYQFMVRSVKDRTEVEDGETPNVLLTLEVTGTGPGRDPVGSVLFHTIYFGDKLKQTIKFYLRTGLLIETEDGKLVDANGDECIDSDALKLLISEVFCGEWTIETYTDRGGKEHSQLRLPYNEIFACDDPRVASWDCNKPQSQPPADGIDEDV